MQVKVANGEDLFTRNGRWNFNNKVYCTPLFSKKMSESNFMCFKTTCMFGQKFVNACKIERWAVVNFSARCDVRNLVRDLMRVAESKGIVCYPYPFDLAALCMKMTGLMLFL